MVNLQYRIFTSEIDKIEWDWNKSKFKPHLFIINDFCQLLMFCCFCLPCVSHLHKNLRSQIFMLSPYLPASLLYFSYFFRCCSISTVSLVIMSVSRIKDMVMVMVTVMAISSIPVLLNSDPEKKKILHPKSIPMSQCYYCTLIFDNLVMFRNKLFEIKPQTGGINA